MQYINYSADIITLLLFPATISGLATKLIKTDRDVAVASHVQESHPYKLKHCDVNQCATLA